MSSVYPIRRNISYHDHDVRRAACTCDGGASDCRFHLHWSNLINGWRLRLGIMDYNTVVVRAWPEEKGEKTFS